jgi:eukaryotic-like serine/threonine-protein kinase
MKLRKYLFVFTIFLTACSGLQVDKSITVNPDDWVMAGGTADQRHVSRYDLVPPLKLAWDYNLEGGVGPAGITSSDAVVFVNALQGEMFTFDVSSGGKIGNLKFLGKDASTAPLILGKDVIVTYAGDKKYSLASYSLFHGKINWRKNFGDVQTSPILKDGYIYFGSLNGSLYKVDITGGTRQWRFNSKAPIHSTCAVKYDNVVFGNDKGSIFCVNSDNGEKTWEFNTGGPVISTPMIEDETVYIGGDDSVYYAININDGSLKWKNNLHTKMIGGSASYADSLVITGCVDGNVYCLNKNTGLVKWKYLTGGTIASSPVVSGEFVYVGSYDSYIYALSANTGSLLWRYELENKVKTTPVIWKEFLFAAADEVLYCFTSKSIEKDK